MPPQLEKIHVVSQRDWGQEEKGTTEDEMLDGITDSMDMSLSELCPDPGMEPVSLTSSALAGGFFTTRVNWEFHSDA